MRHRTDPQSFDCLLCLSSKESALRYSVPVVITAGWIGKDVKSQGGKTLYYSYTTCGSEDLFTEKYNKEACVNQKSPAECQAMGGKCAWTGTRCLGRELAETCHATAPAATSPSSPGSIQWHSG